MLLSTIQFCPGQNICHNLLKNFDVFLQSIVRPYILLWSVAATHFEGKVVYQKNTQQVKSFRLIYNMMSFERKKLIDREV